MGSVPAASIIIPNIMGRPLSPTQVRSACRQHLVDIEIIVSDDCSSDNSIDVISRMMSEDPRIRLVKSDRNGGAGAARNRALAVASGEWIAVLDNDDLMHPDRLVTLIGAALRSGGHRGGRSANFRCSSFGATPNAAPGSLVSRCFLAGHRAICQG